jgi:hypothetical protein
MRLATAIVALSATVALAAPAERWSTPCGGHVGTCLIEKSKYNVHKKSRPVLKNECICRMLKEHPEVRKLIESKADSMFVWNDSILEEMCS